MKKYLYRSSAILALLSLALFAQTATPAPLTSTLANLTAAQLDAYYAPPADIVPITQPATDPAVYSSPNYIKNLNEQFFEQYAVDVPNQAAYQAYEYSVSQWAQNKTVTLPASPAYSQISQAAFDAWWSQYCATIGSGAPPVNFIVPAPQPPAPVILPAAQASQVSSDPIGAYNGANIYQCAPGDTYPNGAIYSDSTGTYRKFVYITPFGTTSYWLKVK